MSILADHQIRKLAQENNMITPFTESQKRDGVISYGLTSYGYDVRVADEFKIFTDVNSSIVDPKKFTENSFVERNADVCIIPPNSFVLGRTVERFIIPRDVIVICVGKSTYARCFTGDTKVSLVNGTSATFFDLVERSKNGERFWGYSINSLGKIVISELMAPRKVGVEKVIEIVLDNDEVIRSTPDHRFIMRDGSEVEAKDLSVGDSLMPLYRITARGYETVIHPQTYMPQPTHALADDWNLRHGVYQGNENEHRHHTDHNRRNNYPTNISRINASKHISDHNAERFRDNTERDRLSEIQKKAFEKYSKEPEWMERFIENSRYGATVFWTDPKYAAARRERSEKLRLGWGEKNSQKRTEASEKMRIRMLNIDNRIEAGNRLRDLWNDEGFRKIQRDSVVRREDITEESLIEALERTGSIRAAARELKCDRSVFRRFERVILDFKERQSLEKISSENILAALKQSGSVSAAARILGIGRKKLMSYTKEISEFFGYPVMDNHKVVAIREVDGEHDVYCLSVPEFGNFALESGVFVKNCGLVVNVTPLEPGWEGYITLEFSNTTPLPAKLYANEGACQLLFFKGDPCEVSYADRKGKYMDQVGVTLPKL